MLRTPIITAIWSVPAVNTTHAPSLPHLPTGGLYAPCRGTTGPCSSERLLDSGAAPRTRYSSSTLEDPASTQKRRHALAWALAAGVATIVVGDLPANAESNPAHVLGGMLDLYNDLKKSAKQRAEPQEFDDGLTDDSGGNPSAYKIGDFRLGQHVTSSNLRGYVCKPSDQFAGSTWCVRSKGMRGARGEFTLSESLLTSNDGKVVYVNRSYAPAFFDAKEIAADIDRKSRQLGEMPRIQRSPHRAGYPDGTIAVWGGASLAPLEGQALQLVAQEQSPNAGFIIDLLNDPALSARSGLPVYRIAGDAPGYVWAATVGPNGVGRLRFLAIDPRQASIRLATAEEAKAQLNVAAPTRTALSPTNLRKEDPKGQPAQKTSNAEIQGATPRLNTDTGAKYQTDIALPTSMPLCSPAMARNHACPTDEGWARTQAEHLDPAIRSQLAPHCFMNSSVLATCVRAVRENQEAAARAAEQQKVAEVRRAQQQAALQVARAKRDPSDVVEQVLNYTVTGQDQGTENNFWFKPDPTQQCVYERVMGVDETGNKVADVVNIFATAIPAAFDLKTLDLNKLDFAGLSVEYEPVLKRLVVAHDGQPILTLRGGADAERVKRGWRLIYEEGHCQSLKRAF